MDNLTWFSLLLINLTVCALVALVLMLWAPALIGLSLSYGRCVTLVVVARVVPTFWS